MQISVSLQEPFSYSSLYIIFTLIPVLIISIFFLIKLIKKNMKDDENIPVVKGVSEKNLAQIKIKYLKKIDFVENKLQNRKISIRIAYQNLSSIIRGFVHEVTDINVHNYTLNEIRKLDMPNLFELVQEYYAPEFSEHSIGNITISLDKTRKVIERWS